ncbi:unnamed protein product (macronuclear) [Paramecium tetraurelia]|uniref:Uncharacterized protein n=1 Tax=Paramecium tetraurelia TaxID=5888 RepID=A0DQW7_PARTE|nr:uncharacterized protein GSPATT00002834001 [Paramecium tetraurelia]CAK85434.1 unnamed protein product [Paramecium tetraurelia]|eukprot:XP_001452831.1 hypothetical protein (macronuclear) [Paramecium tetraurelia strain d4-2]
MGTSICVKESKQAQEEIKTRSQCLSKIVGPPHLFKPTPVISILITDEQVEKEESPKNELSQSQNGRRSEQLLFYTAQQSEEIDSQQQNPWIKKNFAIEAINISKFKNDDMNNSKNGNPNDNLNNSFEQKNSMAEPSKQKPALRKRSGQESSNISNSAGSQRSIKKVSFDKKQQVVYTKYKN